MAAKTRFTSPVVGNHPSWLFCPLLVLSVLFFRSGFGQIIIPDGIKNQLPVQYDVAWIDRMNAQSAKYISLYRRDSALHYAGLSFAGSENLHYSYGLAVASLRLSQIALCFDDDRVLSGRYNEAALGYFEKSANKKGLDTVYYNLFSAALFACRYEEAMDYSDKLYAYASQNKDQNEIYLSLSGMFELNLEKGNYEKCLVYAEQLYNIAAGAGNNQWISSSLWNLARLYTDIEDFPEALSYYQRAVKSRETNPNQDGTERNQTFRFEMEYAEAFTRMNQFDSAWYHYQLYKPADTAYRRLYWLSTGEYYFQRGNFLQALENFNLALPVYIKKTDLTGTMRALLDISRVYLTTGNAREAINYGRKGLDIALQTGANANIRDGYKILSEAYDRLGKSDSSNNYFRKYAIIKEAVLNAQARTRLAAYSYEQRIEMMSKEKQLREIQLQKETWVRNILIGSILLILLLAFFVFRNITLKRKYEARRRELAENELRIQVLESGKSLAESLQLQSELEMKALRAQMNPHFIFNCLNSINRFIIKNDAGKAADYLTKFARLIRLVLERSGKPLISLEEELNGLKLYMDLEAIRFEKPFTYEIHTGEMDISNLMIPSLIIQPFVENAIWHGLHPNEAHQGKISIGFSLENELLHCTISDNGIGIAGSMALKGNDSGNRKSFGTELTRQRLQLANPGKGKTPDFTFTALKDEAGNNAGTRVHIEIPVKTTNLD